MFQMHDKFAVNGTNGTELHSTYAAFMSRLLYLRSNVTGFHCFSLFPFVQIHDRITALAGQSWKT